MCLKINCMALVLRARPFIDSPRQAFLARNQLTGNCNRLNSKGHLQGNSGIIGRKLKDVEKHLLAKKSNNKKRTRGNARRVCQSHGKKIVPVSQNMASPRYSRVKNPRIFGTPVQYFFRIYGLPNSTLSEILNPPSCRANSLDTTVYWEKRDEKCTKEKIEVLRNQFPHVDGLQLPR